MDVSKMGAIQLQNPCHPTGLLHKANQMRLAGTLCDVVIMVDSQEFHAHRTVLACTSKMFEILFHRNSQHYTLDFLSPKTFQQILEYAYTATLQAKVEDLDDLLYAAEILEIEYLEEQCLKILETIQASEDNDAEGTMADGGATAAEEEEERRSRYIKGLFVSKPAGEESGYAGTAGQSLGFLKFGALKTQTSHRPQDSLERHREGEDSSFHPEPPLAGREGGWLLAYVRKGMYFCQPRAGGLFSARQGSAVGSDAPEAAVPQEGPLVASWSPSRAAGVESGRPSPPPQRALPVQGRPPGAGQHLTLHGAAFGGCAGDINNETPRSCGSCGFYDASGRSGVPHAGLGGCPSSNPPLPFLSPAGAKALVCDQCGAQFSKEDALETHRQTHTGTDMAVFCLLCGKRFQTQSALQQHMEVHAGVRSYICSECNRTFPSHTALKRHLRSHTGDHPYECEFCGSCFRDESTLKGHKRIHTGEKPYECNGCGKKFSLKHQLETHYRVHTGEKPFECKLCHQRSRDYSAMIKHLRTHNGASPYQCTICLEYCPSLSAMQKHMKGHKPEEIPTDWRIEKTYLYLCYV
uniref:Zinc finger and BTB domain-containing protein 16 n=1 Tax=Bubo bubo TaxID=30461 RepID=A0A8C0ICL9_BUBBB